MLPRIVYSRYRARLFRDSCRIGAVLGIAFLIVSSPSHRRRRIAAEVTTNFSEATPSKGCAVLEYTETRFNGLGSQILRQVDAAYAAVAINASLRIINRKYWNYGCAPFGGRECYFHPLPASTFHCDVRIPLSSWSSYRILAGRLCCTIANRLSASIAADILRNSSGSDIRISRLLARPLWIFNERTASEISLMLRKAGLREGIKYVGVHIRRGDKQNEVPFVSLQRYLDAVKLLAPANDIPVFVASDDGNTVVKLTRAFSPRKVFSVPGAIKRHGHFQKELNSGYMKRKRNIVVELLAEIEALRNATWFVGTFSSNMGRLIHVLRDREPNTSVSLDDRWEPGVAWRTFGKPYCSSPGSNEIFCDAVQGLKR